MKMVKMFMRKFHLGLMGLESGVGLDGGKMRLDKHDFKFYTLLHFFILMLN
jgi:hypothetical protein